MLRGPLLRRAVPMGVNVYRRLVNLVSDLCSQGCVGHSAAELKMHLQGQQCGVAPSGQSWLVPRARAKLPDQVCVASSPLIVQPRPGASFSLNNPD